MNNTLSIVQLSAGARVSALVITRNLPGNSSQSQRDCVLQPRFARHELPWDNNNGQRQPQRGCGRVGRRAAATPLETSAKPTRFAFGAPASGTARWEIHRFEPCRRPAFRLLQRSPLGLEKSRPPFTQGSSGLATLGFGPESLWDSSADAGLGMRVMTRASARFNVRGGAALEMPAPLPIRAVKRRERRAPPAPNVGHPIFPFPIL
jgi:hypothetical protein